MTDKGRDPVLERSNQEKRLPFEVKTPNAESIEAMTELDRGKGERFAGGATLFKNLGL